MGSPLPPDPYLALGVAKDASAAAIKLQYRKLVLKFHPDKVQDESQKQVAADQFHKIQTAWEIVGEEDKRKRYDAQCDLAQLRKDMLSERHGGAPPRGGREARTSAFKGSMDIPRGAPFHAREPDRRGAASPTYEERRPSFADAYEGGGDYFDYTPRASATRKDAEYERPSKRPPSRDHAERTKPSKETKDAKERERSRQTRERNRRSDRDIRRKSASVVEEEDSESDPDAFEQASRRPKEDPAVLKRAQDFYHEQARKQKEDAQRGYFDTDERTRKMYSQYDGARDYVEKSRGSRPRLETESRPSPARMSSSRDKVEYIKRSGASPVMVRRGSGMPTTAGRESGERRSSAHAERRWSDEEHEEMPRRPPGLSQSKSSPADIKIPGMDKPRSHSLQADSPMFGKDNEDFPPKIKRADTMPHVNGTREREVPRRKDGMPNMPSKGSSLRQTELVDGMPTPGTTPEHSGNTSNGKPYRYQQAYADDHEYPTPDGYKTELRQPPSGGGAATSNPRYTKSPERMFDRERERERPHRAASARHEDFFSPHRPAQPSRTTSTSYVYTPGQGVNESHGRPTLSREDSSARMPSSLYGEIPTTASSTVGGGRDGRDREMRSPRQSSSRHSPPAEGVRYARDLRPEDIRMQSGYGTSSRRTSEARPTYSRGGSYVYAK
ncbi:hypothetical protein LTR91_010487 [Friedmanniomyces endolithicus]|uniref:J domain-containing protein n=1 Tax=Friedmanniomyces endolithicus TaxID=329885 RepID=A0AAN6JA07_9PEZI|nr:hypothetical protein LTR35_005571 [Friedmanniomyces endolithicus]KAK0297600.1 hypothetical protein LTS00_003732 [Friedmanniomyces endolithicus]KAK0322074.1 hypothetical protein LTR82_007048 [Friedmanniomyces endolithicus]KAK0930728.1 hypothetical protein LTR57_001109 [Friedmanniomyces endolithicus]KAK0985751.1 hypothetical protein LTR91_010487 [Friedmanniomyces endolithicus]